MQFLQLMIWIRPQVEERGHQEEYFMPSDYRKGGQLVVGEAAVVVSDVHDDYHVWEIWVFAAEDVVSGLWDWKRNTPDAQNAWITK